MSSEGEGRLSEEQRGRVKMFPPAIGMFLLLAAIVAFMDSPHFLHAMLAGVWFATTLGIGALVFVLGQQALQSRWAAVPRRPMEWLAASFPYGWATALVLCAVGPWLYAWWSDPASDWPARWYRPGSFWAKTILFLILLGAVGARYAMDSAAQDARPSPALAARMRRLALPFLVLVFACTVGLAIEWILGLHAPELSFALAPVFSLYVLAGGLSGAVAVAVIAMVLYERGGLVGAVWAADDRGRLGRLLAVALVATAVLGAVMVWVTSSLEPQTLQAWRPHFAAGGWQAVTWVFVAFHAAALVILVFPRRPAGRRGGGMVLAAVLVLAGRYLEAYLLVMPVWRPTGPSASLIYEVAGLAVGLAAPWIGFFLRLPEKAVYPVNDPLLERKA